MTLALNRGDFVDSTERCPNDGKLLVVEAHSDGDRVHHCLERGCDHTHLELHLPVSVRDVVAAVAAQRGIQWPTEPCGRCGAPVVLARTLRGKAIYVDPQRREGGSMLLHARVGMLPLASSLPMPKRIGRELHTAHVETCGKAVAA